jgi:Chalcone isomerase-like
VLIFKQALLSSALVLTSLTPSFAWAQAAPAAPTAATTAAVTEVAGVKYDNAITLGGTPIVLNGAGVRYKAIFKVYAAGLYLPKKTKVVSEALGQPGAKRIHITMLRDIDANELGKLFSRGIEDEIPKNDFAKLVPSIIRMSNIFSEYKTLKSGDTFTIDWLPGKGTVITIKGKVDGEPMKEPEFFTAMLSIWLGKTPPDYKLKEALMQGG